MSDANDFYEDDEPVERITAIFESGEKGVTGQVRGWTATLSSPSVTGPFSGSSTSMSGNLVAS